jgi:hypothetical protein
MKQNVLDDPILSYLSSCHIGPVLQLPQKSHLRSLMAHHRWKGCHLARLVFLN